MIHPTMTCAGRSWPLVAVIALGAAAQPTQGATTFGSDLSRPKLERFVETIG